MLIESRYLTRSREDAKWGTHHCEARENGDTPSGADCRLPANLTTPVTHLASAACVSVRVFASSREPNSPQRPPLHALRGRGYRGGVPGTQHPESPPTSHAGFSHAQKFAIPHAKSRSAKWGTHHCEPRSGGHSTESGGHTTENGDTPSRSRLQTASKSPHAGHSPCIGRLRFRSRLRGFA